MPIPVMIPKKTVVREERNVKMLALLDRVLMDHGIVAGEMHAEEARNRRGWWASILVKVEMVDGEVHGGQSSDLPELDHIFLQHPAMILRNAYVDYLNTLLVEQESENIMDEIDSEEISSRYHLMYEILIRLATVALCTDMNGHRDGDLILSVLGDYIAGVSKGGWLNSTKHSLGHLLRGEQVASGFETELTRGYQHWLSNLRDMVTAVKLLYAQKTAMPA